MKYCIILSVLATLALAQDGCGFPDGPDCVSLGEGANGLEQFADDGCCLLPFRCGNGDGGERCERVAVESNNDAGNADEGSNNGNAGNNGGNNNQNQGNQGNNNNNNDNGDGNGNEANNDGGNQDTNGNNNTNNNNNDANVDATDEDCGFPNGPDCESLGQGANGLEQFVNDGCCLLPFRCGNTTENQKCEFVAADAARVRSIRAARAYFRSIRK